MKRKLSYLILTAFTLTAVSVSGGIYKVVDPKTGKVTYTDTPPPTTPSSSVNLPPVNTQDAPPPQLPGPIPDEEEVWEGYREVAIVQPRHDATIPPGQLNIVVQVKTTPVLQENDLIRLLFNDRPVSAPASSTSFAIEDLVRGSHQIKAQVLDASGKVVKESETITIHVKRGSARFNPR